MNELRAGELVARERTRIEGLPLRRHRVATSGIHRRLAVTRRLLARGMKDRRESADAGAGQGMVTGLVRVRVIDTDEEFMSGRLDRLR